MQILTSHHVQENYCKIYQSPKPINYSTESLGESPGVYLKNLGLGNYFLAVTPKGLVGELSSKMFATQAC